MYYLLLYDVVDDYVTRRAMYREDHLSLARAAHERGISHFRGEILADNDAIRELLASVGAEFRASETGRVVFDVAVDREPPADSTHSPARRLLAAASTWLAGLFRAR